MEIRQIQSQEVWENFLAEVKPHTFLQSWNWGIFNEETGHKIWRLGFYDSNQLVGIALVLKVTARRGSFLFVPHGLVSRSTGSISGGIDSQPPDNAAGLIASLTDFLKSMAKQEQCAFFRISPLLSASLENDKIFTQLGYREAPVHMMHPELAWMLDITPSEEKLLAGMRKTTRYSIKKAEKDGVNITTSSSVADVEKFYNVYETTVERQQFVAFSKDYIKKEFEVFSKDNQALFFFAEYQNQTVGAALIIFYGDSAFYHHGATTRRFPGLTDAQLLQWHVIKEAKRRGLQYYNFWGVVPETDVNHPWHGLSLFKRGFGGFAEAYVHAKDFAISPKYWLNFAVEKIRKIKRGL